MLVATASLVVSKERMQQMMILSGKLLIISISTAAAFEILCRRIFQTTIKLGFESQFCFFVFFFSDKRSQSLAAHQFG